MESCSFLKHKQTAKKRARPKIRSSFPPWRADGNAERRVTRRFMGHLWHLRHMKNGITYRTEAFVNMSHFLGEAPPLLFRLVLQLSTRIIINVCFLLPKMVLGFRGKRPKGWRSPQVISGRNGPYLAPRLLGLDFPEPRSFIFTKSLPYLR